MGERLLDIIIPHYKESWDVCRPMFDILCAQKGVDFNEFKVWLIHDGPVIDFEPDGYFEKAPLQIETVAIKHKGVSACRNKGLDLSDSEWVCFCDCDDSYSSIFSLMMIFHVLKGENAKNFDLVWGSFYIQSENNLGKHEKFNNVFIHNKYYRRSFLIEHNLRFPEYIYMSEDSAFNTVVHMEIDHKRIGEINNNFPLYSWCRRPGSITMDFSQWIRNTEGHFERNLYILDQYEKHNYKDLSMMVARTITDVYSMLSRPGIPGDWKPLLKNRIKPFYQENKDAYLSVPKDKVASALKASDKDVGHSKEVLEKRLPFDAWVELYLDSAT